MAKLTFLGAAGTVTGSKYLVEAAGKKLLLDCGIFQGTADLSARNFKPLTVAPASIDFCVLTHAHLDHCGWLPCLVRDGYNGPIYANAATIDLATLSLKDSAHLQEEDSDRVKRNARHSDPAERQPLYTSEDIDPMLRLFRPMPRRGGFDVSPEFHFEAYDAGHILGSTSFALTITENSKKTTVVFSGDIGRYDQPILNDPTTPPNADFLLCESTYGDREHQPGDPAAELADVVNRVVRRGGSIVIPAFAIGRTQTFMYLLRQLENQKKIPIVPVYIDSPMALSATDLYVKYKEDHDFDYSKLESTGDRDPLNTHVFHLTRTVEQSKAINNSKTPCIIVSASGMISGGRVLHHLAQRLPDPKNAVLLAGYQAEGTRGRAVQDGAKTINLFGQVVPVNAEIVTMGQLSAHAGKSELLRWLSGLKNAPQKTWLTHGEPAAAQALQAAIKDKFRWDVEVARYLDTVDLGENQ
jgi:metallo-beta-lactamase family protein